MVHRAHNAVASSVQLERPKQIRQKELRPEKTLQIGACLTPNEQEIRQRL